MTKSQSAALILETPRCIIREQKLSDLPFLCALHQDRQVMKYIGPTRNADQVEQRLRQSILEYAQTPGLGIWMGVRKDTNASLGWACLKDLDGSTEIEIGYRLAHAHWGQGFATELACALVDFGFKTHPLYKIAAVCHPENLASEAVLRKAGLTYRRQRHFYGHQLSYFSLTRVGWMKNQV